MQLEGDETLITCSYPSLPRDVKVGATILVADGNLVLTVLEIGEAYVSLSRARTLCALCVGPL